MSTEVTKVQFRTAPKAEKIAANVECILNGDFVARGAMIKSEGKPDFFKFEQRSWKDNDTGKMVYKEICHPITAECRTAILDEIYAKYETWKEEFTEEDETAVSGDASVSEKKEEDTPEE